jgi:hypothetical protein
LEGESALYSDLIEDWGFSDSKRHNRQLLVSHVFTWVEGIITYHVVRRKRKSVGKM